MPHGKHPREQITDYLGLLITEIHDDAPSPRMLAHVLDGAIIKLEFYANVLHSLTARPEPAARSRCSHQAKAPKTRCHRVNRKGPPPCQN